VKDIKYTAPAAWHFQVQVK